MRVARTAPPFRVFVLVGIALVAVVVAGGEIEVARHIGFEIRLIIDIGGSFREGVIGVRIVGYLPFGRIVGLRGIVGGVALTVGYSSSIQGDCPKEDYESATHGARCWRVL